MAASIDRVDPEAAVGIAERDDSCRTTAYIIFRAMAAANETRASGTFDGELGEATFDSLVRRLRLLGASCDSLRLTLNIRGRTVESYAKAPDDFVQIKERFVIILRENNQNYFGEDSWVYVRPVAGTETETEAEAEAEIKMEDDSE
ncbi:hypothetical protein QQS21_005474 [Conoideocrella luteorostrata]|uniref:Uncharacterized protein n=1 Tax=Conoideocrella luteorostrata TaxID=1105319 RepID=A0AAJ0CTP0_9HYPO|nr:hypothetical protein QQS21_005474 [Conoideocrella luteorostrata]